MPLRLFAAASALALLMACAVVPKLEEPTLDIVDARLLSADVLKQELLVRMRVENPNDRELAVRGITYEVQLDGEAFAHGESERNFVVPANGQSEFDVSVTANAAAALLRLLGTGKRADGIEYRITGKVSLSSGLFRSLPFSHTGKVNLR